VSANYFDYAMGHVRLAVLRALVDAPQNVANDSVLATAMGELGLPVTRDQLRGQLGWLEEQGLIRLARPKETMIVASLRERGAEVALGRASVEGVQRPSVGR
jgi:DNA-binding transcriptional ArsR family regulator